MRKRDLVQRPKAPDVPVEAPLERQGFVPADVAGRESISRESKQHFADRTRRGPAH